MERAEDEWGEWGTIYLDERRPPARVAAVRALASLSRGRPTCPPGPPSEDAVLVTCSYLCGNGAEWVEKSLLLAAIGESRDRGARGARGVRLPVSAGRVRRGAVPRPPDGLPA